MDEMAFRKYLKAFGKKDHVVDGLVHQVEKFEDYLRGERRKGLDAANAQDLQDYAARFKPVELKTMVRGLIFYYHHVGNSGLASLAHTIRERETAKTRKVFSLKDFRGVNPEYISRLRSIGVANVEHMLEAGKTPEARQRLADETGIPPESILELVKLSDLSRIEGVKQVRARLYYDAGIDSPEAAARWEPDDLRKVMVEFVERTRFDGIAPLPKEVQHFVRTARALPKIVEH